VPRVNARRTDPDTGQRRRFFGDPSAVDRKPPKATEVLSLLYLHGCSPGHSVPRSAVPGQLGGAVRAGDHQVDRDLEGRAAHFPSERPVRGGLRLAVGRRHPRQHPSCRPERRAGTAALPRGRAVTPFSCPRCTLAPVCAPPVGPRTSRAAKERTHIRTVRVAHLTTCRDSRSGRSLSS
jgi:hypothetical protein